MHLNSKASQKHNFYSNKFPKRDTREPKNPQSHFIHSWTFVTLHLGTIAMQSHTYLSKKNFNQICARNNLESPIFCLENHMIESKTSPSICTFTKARIRLIDYTSNASLLLWKQLCSKKSNWTWNILLNICFSKTPKTSQKCYKLQVINVFRFSNFIKWFGFYSIMVLIERGKWPNWWFHVTKT